MSCRSTVTAVMASVVGVGGGGVAPSHASHRLSGSSSFLFDFTTLAFLLLPFVSLLKARELDERDREKHFTNLSTTYRYRYGTVPP